MGKNRYAIIKLLISKKKKKIMVVLTNTLNRERQLLCGIKRVRL